MEVEVNFTDVETDVDVDLSIKVKIIGDRVQLIPEGGDPILIEDGGTAEISKTVTANVSGTARTEIEPPTPNEGFF